ncbi:glycoside hydrolase family 88/105 protein [Tunturiibacter gelidoferens]|uniref:Rhamnogalacturonyl hydrolase YesR n=1 Tax=Tunturiibacter gelidiferens TaxID=3069689 RepID=A0A9X0U6G2_9BACT|nr:glycoside hydrolase family 88 protein [Edaphobacter lichenicola]MBB5331536.1 rhamnogalacturonyl hydrolase YesR [Edaphobacter lichenicola]
MNRQSFLISLFLFSVSTSQIRCFAQRAAGPQQGTTVDRQASGDAPTDPGPLASDLSAKLDRADIERVMRKVADWQLKDAKGRFNQQWTYAALYDGLLATSRAIGDPKYSDAVTKISEGFEWKLLDTRFPHADDQAIGQAYLDLYRLKREPVRMAATKEIMDRLGAEPVVASKPTWWWCDALFMAPPVLVRMYAITGDSKYLETLDRNWQVTSDLLYSPAEHLFFRDARYLTEKEKNGKPLFWARGNGWVLGGLVNVLQFMPKNYPTRDRYVAQFREMATRIAQLQTADGLWKTGLLDPDAYMASEVSGSAFFTYAIAWGINEGILDRKTFRPVVERSWAGMVKHIYADGRLGAIQPIGAAPDSFTPSSSYVYGVGGFLLAGSELMESTHKHSPRQIRQ